MKGYRIYVSELWIDVDKGYAISYNKALRIFNNALREECKDIYNDISDEDFSEKVISFREWNKDIEIICRTKPFIMFRNKENDLIARVFLWGESDYENGEADIGSKDITLEEIEIQDEFMERNIQKEVVCKCINHGIDINGECDCSNNMHCPNCNEVVGDYELNELWYKYCPECGQRLKYTKFKE